MIHINMFECLLILNVLFLNVLLLFMSVVTGGKFVLMFLLLFKQANFNLLIRCTTKTSGQILIQCKKKKKEVGWTDKQQNSVF